MMNEREEEMSEFPVILIGDIIKSFDFVGITNCYDVGIVTGIEGDMIRCKLLKSVWEGKTEFPKDTGRNSFRTPLPGRMMRDDYGFDRIVVLG